MTSNARDIIKSRLIRRVVPIEGYGDEAGTVWFEPPEEGALAHVEWDREVAVVTYIVTRYPPYFDGVRPRMMQSRWPKKAGEDTVAWRDEDGDGNPLYPLDSDGSEGGPNG